MNIGKLHPLGTEISSVNLFKGETGTVTAIRLKLDNTLQEHVSKIPALLLCIQGKVIYEDENGQKAEMEQGDYLTIKPDVKHRLYASLSSQLILLK